MPMALLPVGKILHVCDDVVADPTSHKLSILNLWELVRVPVGASFPYTLGRICVVALMSDGQGEARFRAEVVRADTGTTIRRSPDYTVHFTDRQRSALVVIRLKDVLFPGAGVYLVELYCEGVFVDDRFISVVSN
jgi:hypothetical protein